MDGRNIPRYAVILTALFVVAFLLGLLAPIPRKMNLFGELKDAFEPILTLSPWKSKIRNLYAAIKKKGVRRNRLTP